MLGCPLPLHPSLPDLKAAGSNLGKIGVGKEGRGQAQEKSRSSDHDGLHLVSVSGHLVDSLNPL